MDKEFALLAILATHPLRHGYEVGPPLRNCSSAIVAYTGRTVLLTVSHAVRLDEPWAVELYYEGDAGTKLWKLGPMQYVRVIDGAGERDVDFAFSTIPADIGARFQRFSERGVLVEELERVVLASDLTAAPRVGMKYGFAGTTKHTAEPRPPVLPHAISGAELRVETELVYRGIFDGLDVYDLGHAHPGHAAYEGCSGAPVLSEEGDIVGLVVSGSVEDRAIYALPLRNYASAVIAGLSSVQQHG